MNSPLSDAELLRYNRQIILRGFDFEGQEALRTSRALIVGLGGLGCAASQYLAAAGIGHLTLLDFDTVAVSNLARQVLHSDARVGETKVASARQALQALNPHVSLSAIDQALSGPALDAVIADHNLVLDCTDNLDARHALNLSCFQQRIPLVSGAAIRMEGQLTAFNWQAETPCYRCLSRLFGQQALSCVESGVMSPLVGVIGALQAMEAIKMLTGYGEPLVGRVLFYDALRAQFREMRLPRYPGCDVCGQPQTP